MTKTARDVERDVEQTRSDLGSTVSALKEKMTDGSVISEIKDYIGGDRVDRYVRSVRYRITDNPIPSAMAAAGLLWLAVASRSNGEASMGGGGTDETMAMGDMSDDSMQDGFSQEHQGPGEPLLWGLLSFGVGLAIGASIPPTSGERKLARRLSSSKREKAGQEETTNAASEMSGRGPQGSSAPFGSTSHLTPAVAGASPEDLPAPQSEKPPERGRTPSSKGEQPLTPVI